MFFFKFKATSSHSADLSNIRFHIRTLGARIIFLAAPLLASAAWPLWDLEPLKKFT